MRAIKFEEEFRCEEDSEADKRDLTGDHSDLYKDVVEEGRQPLGTTGDSSERPSATRECINNILIFI